MSYTRFSSVCLVLSLLAIIFCLSKGDVGTAGHYTPPYIPTACYGRDRSPFPSSNMFGAAGEGVWDNGASCGKHYLVRCIGADVPETCIPGKIILIRILDRASTAVSRPSDPGASIVLSTTAFAAIANSSASSINIEFRRLF